MNKQRRALLSCLEAEGGEVRCGRGRTAAHVLGKKTGLTLDQVQTALYSMRAVKWVEVESGSIAGVGHGFRRVWLGPEAPHMNGAKANGHAPVIVKAPEPEPPPPPPATIAASPEAVAAALLERCMTIVSQPDRLSEASERLAKQLQYSDSLRHKVQEQGDQLRAFSQEIRGLRQRLRVAEQNLEAAKSDRGHIIDIEVRKRLARFMEEVPSEHA